MPSSRFTVVPDAYVYLLRGEGAWTEVLLQRRGAVPYMSGHWAAGAAGHVEHGETAYDTARREATEELGVDDLDLTFVTTMHHTQGADPIDQRVSFFFTARSWSGDPSIQEPEKATELTWARLDDLPAPMVPHEEMLLSRLAAGPLPPYLSRGF